MPAEGTLSLYIDDEKVGEGEDQDPARQVLARRRRAERRQRGRRAGHRRLPRRLPWAFVGGTIHQATVDVSRRAVGRPREGGRRRVRARLTDHTSKGRRRAEAKGARARWAQSRSRSRWVVQSRFRTSRARSGSRAVRLPDRRCRARHTRRSSSLGLATRSRCWRSRLPHVCRNSSRFGTDECSPHRSPSIVAAR